MHPGRVLMEAVFFKKGQDFPGNRAPRQGDTKGEVMKMSHERGRRHGPRLDENIRLNPEKRLCPSFDSETIAKYPVASRREMGVRVVDNFCEEHIQ